jgi:hypothetical protein
MLAGEFNGSGSMCVRPKFSLATRVAPIQYNPFSDTHHSAKSPAALHRITYRVPVLVVLALEHESRNP